MDNDQILIFQKPIAREVSRVLAPLPKVEIVKCYLGMNPALISGIEGEADGIILEGMGRGQVPPELIGAIEKAVQQGVTVVLTTTSEEGKVYPTYDYPGSSYDLMNKGVILGSDYDSKKARIKLMVLLSAKMDVKRGFLNEIRA